MKFKVLILSTLVCFCLPAMLEAQFSGSNMAEYQLGNIPGEEPSNQSSLYNQLDLKYRYKGLSLFTKAELYQPSFGEDINYARLSQFRASYSTKSLSLEVGHSYTSLGRGLLMRNYSLPSSIYEDRGYRIRYAYNKDILGVTAKYKSKYVDVKLVRGTVLTVGLPPTLPDEDRRTDLVEGGEITGKFLNQALGVLGMRHTNGGISANYGGLFYNGNIAGVTLYGEIAKQLDDTNFLSFDEQDAYGAYLGLNYAKGMFGGSFELKKYQNFSIGNGVNDPPTLIKEHNVRLLNRSTHVPHLSYETGYQVEIYVSFDNGSVLTLNNAMANNEIGINEHTFTEYYADYYFNVSDNIQLKVLADYAQDPLINEPHRYTTGLSADVQHGKLSSYFEFDIQWIEREIVTTDNFSNIYTAYTLSQAGKFSASAILEMSSDPFFLEDDDTQNFYPAAAFTYDIDKHNKITAFAGRRRGGPSCTSGVCYDVLDFEGIELRLVTRF